ncbi:unnamed protein product [Adineta ricciae]|uniref:Carotenoid 1,2-hydratase n=1 Tax=Adineta ricciae TaxID=249248 RepID=A0A814QHY3_ADIRI|nr:unnamed protein product [Adineta ricciae]
MLVDLLIFFFSLIFISNASINCPDNETYNMESDGYRYLHKKDPLISVLYREWWFFALYDPKIDIGFCVGYSVADPAKTFHLQMAGIAGMLWTSTKNNSKNNLINILDSYEYSQFSAYKENATVSIGNSNFLKVLNPTTYELRGKSLDNQINWNLSFQQMSYPCQQGLDIPELLELDWISYMPSAFVFGTIQYENRTYSINTTAYHDHNYGAWPTNLFNWIWAQFHRVDKQFSLVLGSYHIPLTEDIYIGYIFIRWRNLRIKIGTLCEDQFHLKPLEWQIVDGRKYSIHNQIEAFNQQYKIDIDYKAKVSDNNPGGRGLGLKVFEQISFYQVVLYEKQNQTWIVLEEDLNGFGFSEWSHTDI